MTDLHRGGCLELPNSWDVGSALMLQSMGCQALADTRAGFEWSRGRPDGDTLRVAPAQCFVVGHADLEETIARLRS